MCCNNGILDSQDIVGELNSNEVLASWHNKQETVEKVIAIEAGIVLI